MDGSIPWGTHSEGESPHPPAGTRLPMRGEGMERVNLPEPILSLENRVGMPHQWEPRWPAVMVLGEGWRGSGGGAAGAAQRGHIGFPWQSIEYLHPESRD